MILTIEEIRVILDRLKLEQVFREGNFVVCKHRGIGYSMDPQIAAIETKLSIMLGVAAGSRPSTPDERQAFNKAVKGLTKK